MDGHGSRIFDQNRSIFPEILTAADIPKFLNTGLLSGPEVTCRLVYGFEF